VKYILYRQHNRDRLGTVLKLATKLFLSSVSPILFKVIRQPDRDRAALIQSFIIFRPVFDTV
jgi:hypothetical protein